MTLMLSCRGLTELITDYVEGHLSFFQRLRFQLHLGMCVHCRVFLRQTKFVVRALGRLPCDQIPATTREELLQRFKTWHFRDWKKRELTSFDRD